MSPSTHPTAICLLLPLYAKEMSSTVLCNTKGGKGIWKDGEIPIIKMHLGCCYCAPKSVWEEAAAAADEDEEGWGRGIDATTALRDGESEIVFVYL